MKRINRFKIVKWDVEEHTGGTGGVGAGPRTGNYDAEDKAIIAMARSIADGNGVTCIIRNRHGSGRMVTLGLV